MLDLYFVDARARLIDIAAFLDRVERAEGTERTKGTKGTEGTDDFREEAFRRALKELEKPGADRARRVLLALSDPTREPAAKASGKGACGAFPSHTSLQSLPET